MDIQTISDDLRTWVDMIKERLIIKDLHEMEQSLIHSYEKEVQLCNAIKKISSVHIDKVAPGTLQIKDEFSKVVRISC